MAILETSLIATEVRADLQAVLDALTSGHPVDPDVARRVELRSDQARREILEKHGVLNVAVELVREARDDA